MNKEQVFLPSPVGLLKISARGNAVVSIEFSDTNEGEWSMETADTTNPVLKECVRQLEEYFHGTRKAFQLEIDMDGSSSSGESTASQELSTPFQREAWKQLLGIPYGTTIPYGEQARRLGNPNASRAVGNANRKNRIPIIIPCHRVIGKDGSLTGYAGGTWRKKWLLVHELKNR
ncbi:MAG: methylated-DNA--[protein]-cysteine S-methyltransferase [bacterium]|nr:methylated-DNA--[protein]-cysteine S-methyltransferase [bacterium]